MTGYVVSHRGHWYPRVEMGTNSDGKRVRKWGPRCRTKREASFKLAEMVHQMNEGSYLEPSKQALGDYLNSEWLPAIRSTIKPSTWDSYRRNLTLHVVPKLGAISLSKLQPAHLNDLYASLAEGERPLAPKTIRYIHTILHRALKDATRWSKIGRNVAALADPPRPRAPEGFRIWTPVQLRSFLDAVSQDRLYALFFLALTTGLRRGELLGVRWCDLDLDKGRLSIRQTVISIGYEIQYSEPKTARSRRTIALDPASVSALKAHRTRQLEERLAWGSAWEESELVFTREDGRPIHPHSVSGAFERAVKRSGLPPLRFHDLRHTYATLALEAGMKPWDLSDRLGHSTVAFTLQVYRHAIQATQESAAAMAAEFIVGSHK
ncbi:site-specific integrase [soil metagenome]